jgi:hypothetical protein
VPDGAPATIETYDAIHRAAAALTAPVASILFDLGEDRLVQVPFAQSAVSWRSLHLAGGAGERVVCAALSAREARNQALLLAAERWAAATWDPQEGGASAVGAGWSFAEAALRALGRLACKANGGEEKLVELPALQRFGRSTTHLVEMAGVIGLHGTGSTLAAAPATGGGWLGWHTGLPSGPRAFGATIGQALGNSLFQALVEQSTGGEARAAMLSCDATGDDVRQVLLDASYHFELHEVVDLSLTRDLPGAGLRLIEAKRRSA